MQLIEKKECDIAWCPGCGNFAIRDIVAAALAELSIDRRHFVMVSGIGQAAKSPQYLDVHYFNGLHGRALPPATAIKAVNPNLTVLVESGDGDMYGEGGNHFMHAIRRNPDITVLVHNNMIYGLTKGQASPTTLKGMHTPLQVDGVFNEPFNPLAVAIALDCSFVARANSGDHEQTKDIIMKAVRHRGFSLVDIFQPCVSFNKMNTFMWFRKNSYYLDAAHQSADRQSAFARACETERYPLGVFYVHEKPVFGDGTAAYGRSKIPLVERAIDPARVQPLLDALT
ncbi:MAG: 2-oxoacid ferredoxin oxidoreductase [Spirochaetes bacterium]|nr:2-oxoacid ferredoxin oxidoreductase [Spirochaetota bacterium]